MVGVCLVQLTFHRGKQNIRGHNGKEVGRGYKLLETGKKTHFGLNLDPSSQGPFPSHYGLTTTQPICCSFLPPPPKSIKCLHGVSKRSISSPHTSLGVCILIVVKSGKEDRRPMPPLELSLLRYQVSCCSVKV